MSQDTHRKKVGRMGEDIACKFLEQKGFQILDRNYRKPWGEIDIIAEKSDQIRFVEVKTVSREAYQGISREIDYRPEEMVNAKKLKKLTRTAALYMETTRDEREYQIDVIGIIINEHTRTAHCRLFEQALEDNL